MISDEEIVRILKKKDIQVPKFDGKGDANILLKSLWILNICKENTLSEALSPTGISHIAYKILEEDIHKNSISKALSRAGKKIKRHGGGFVEIMGPGKKELEKLRSLDQNKITLITGERPWTDKNKEFMGLISGLKREIFILDPYYGLETLHVLSSFGNTKKVYFLTSKMGGGETPALVNKEIARFKKEFKNIEMRTYPKFDELHDRYIISDNFFVIVGHGLKDIGNKECFLIAIPAEDVKEVITTLKINFKKRWKNSTILN